MGTEQRSRFRTFVLRVACIALAGYAVLAATPSRQDSSAPPAPASAATSSDLDSLTATLRAVDLSAGSIELVTGVGYALRVVRFEAPEWKGAGAGLAGPRPGDVVRVRYHTTSAGRMAISVEAVPLD